MANEEGTATPVRKKKSRKLTYFYLNGKLHRKLHINRGADTLTAWCYPDHCRVAYTYSDVLRRHNKAFTTMEVCKMLMRGRTKVEMAIVDGMIERPQHTYSLNENKRMYKYMWSEADVMAAHAYFSTVHRGRPRHDGLVTPQKLPTARELRAMMRNDEILYIKQGDKLVPTWQAENF